jgi:uncharacterized membrane protein YhhN
MTGGAWVAMIAAGVFAVGDWVGVLRERKLFEYVGKPLTMVALVAAAVALEPIDSSQRAWFVAALVLSLLGDIFLMLPDREMGPADTFTFGLASFLLGHVAYIVGFFARGVGSAWVVAALLATLPILVIIGGRVIRGARAKDPKLGVAVTVYMVVLVAMLDVAWWSGVAAAMAGAVLFVASDAMIGWSRFVKVFRNHHIAIIVTYHLAQALLVVSLATS